MSKHFWVLFIKPGADRNDPKVRENVGRRGGVFGIICNAILFLAKLTVGILSNSVSILADAFNNLTDMGSSLITILGFKIAGKPADRGHPFGHGRMEYMSAAAVSGLITIVGFELLKTSAEKLFSPEKITASAITYAVLLFSVAVKLWMAYVNKKLGKKIDSAALCAVSLDSLSDCAATAAVLAATAVSQVWNVNIDAYAGIAVSAFILYSGVKSFKETIDPLMGMPPDKETVEEIKNTVMSFDGFLGIHDLIVHNYGPGRSFASVHVEVPSHVDVVKCHEQIDLCEKLIDERFGIETVIHMDPVDTDNEKVGRVKNALEKKIKEYDSRLSIHDFRMVSGKNRTNLVFDVLEPYGYSLDKEQLVKDIGELAKQIDENYVCVITVDTSYVLPE